MSEIEKPRRKPGMICPLMRRDVSKVCHKCELYQALPLEEIDPASRTRQGKVFEAWGCALNHLVKVGRDAVSTMDGAQRSIEDFRNNVAAANKMQLALQARDALEDLAARNAAKQIPNGAGDAGH